MALPRRRKHKDKWGYTPKAEKPLPFQAAWDKMILVERAMVDRMVKPTFTLSDVADYLWDPYMCHVLREAFKFCPAGTNYNYEQFNIGIGRFSINFNFTAAGMTIPRPGLITLQNDAPRKEQIEDALQSIAAVVYQCRRVYCAIDWLNTMKATPGQAKYVLPQLGALLPAEHPFHTAKPAHIPLDVYIRPIMRDAVNVIVMGLLSDPTRDLKPNPNLSITVFVPDISKFSQGFGIL